MTKGLRDMAYSYSMAHYYASDGEFTSHAWNKIKQDLERWQRPVKIHYHKARGDEDTCDCEVRLPGSESEAEEE